MALGHTRSHPLPSGNPLRVLPPEPLTERVNVTER
jgi:hypothetical protein